MLAPPLVWSSPFVIGSTPWSFLSQLNTRPVHAPVYDSHSASRLKVQDSGSGWVTTPVRLFHSRHHAGLSRRTTKPILDKDFGISGLGLFWRTALFPQFQYDAKQPFDTTCEPIASRTDAGIQECEFTVLAAGASTSFWSSPAEPSHRIQG